MKKVVLAYSGGLDTSVILKWIKETYGCEVIAYVADLGQKEDLEEIRVRARETGASQVVVEDVREEFVTEYVFPALRANAVYEGTYLMGTSLARPLIARRQLAVAHREGAEAVAHGATGKGNDQVRFELTYLALDPHIKVVAPWREWDFRSRKDLIDYARAKDIKVTVTAEKPYSVDANLLHTSYEGGVLEDPWAEPPDRHVSNNRVSGAGAGSPTTHRDRFREGESGRRGRRVDVTRKPVGTFESHRRRQRDRQGGHG